MILCPLINNGLRAFPNLVKGKPKPKKYLLFLLLPVITISSPFFLHFVGRWPSLRFWLRSRAKYVHILMKNLAFASQLGNIKTTI